jgi:elongation factor Ts
MAITTEVIKELRDRTGVSIMQCKKALEEAGGDVEKAIVIIQKQSKTAAAKKSDRTLGAGAIGGYMHATGNVGAMVELACETDFVARNDEFKALARDIAMHITASNPQFLKKDEIPLESRKTAEEVFVKEVADKPKEMQEKILASKLDAYFADLTLLDQPFIKDQEKTIQNLIETTVQKFGERIEIVRFARFAVGE